MQFSNLVDSLVRAALPPRCTLCGTTTPGALLCEPCAAELPWNTPCCPGCALPTASGALCPACAQAAEPYDAAFSALRFEGPVQRAVHGLKYSARFLNAALLASLMAQPLKQRLGPLPQLLLPMPLARGRQFKRGYNQAQQLAAELGKALAIPVNTIAAKRLRTTEDQIGKSRRERQANVKGAFTLSADVTGQHIALVDDVMTTGATLAELSRAARAAGAARIEVWTAARAVLHQG